MGWRHAGSRLPSWAIACRRFAQLQWHGVARRGRGAGARRHVRPSRLAGRGLWAARDALGQLAPRVRRAPDPARSAVADAYADRSALPFVAARVRGAGRALGVGEEGLLVPLVRRVEGGGGQGEVGGAQGEEGGAQGEEGQVAPVVPPGLRRRERQRDPLQHSLWQRPDLPLVPEDERACHRLRLLIPRPLLTHSHWEG